MLMHMFPPVQGGVAKPPQAGEASKGDPDVVHHQWMPLCPDMTYNPGLVGVPMMWPVDPAIQSGFVFTGVAPPSTMQASGFHKNQTKDYRRQRHARPANMANTDDALTSEEIEELRLAVQNTYRKLQNASSSDISECLPGVADMAMTNVLPRAKECDNDTLSSRSSTRIPESRQVSSEDFVDVDGSANYANTASGKEAVERRIRDADVTHMFSELESSNLEKRAVAIEWVVSSTWPLALTRPGCRIVQRAMELADPETQERLVGKLEGFVLEALQSPHANYVLQKCFEIMPPHKLEFVLRELSGQVAFIARHRFGCRIMQRALEHCSHDQNKELIAEVLMDARQLIRHTYGNFVIQHVLQYGTPKQVHELANVLLEDAGRFAKHRIASHVITSALSCCSPEDVSRLNEALALEQGPCAALSFRRYGGSAYREPKRANTCIAYQ